MTTTKFTKLLWLYTAILFASGVAWAKVGFYPQKVYVYEYVGQVRAGLPEVGTDKTATGISASVIIVPTGSELLVKLEEIRTFTGNVLGYEETLDEIPMQYERNDQPELSRPFKILYRGESDEFVGVEVAQDDPAWSVNIKKALGVLLNVRLDRQLSKRQGTFAAQRPADYEPIDIVESGIEGKCVTKYVYARQLYPGRLNNIDLNVTKIRDAKSCKESPIWTQTISEGLKCSSCQSSTEEIINYGSTSYYTAFEDNGQYTIQKAENFAQTNMVMHPPKGDKIRITEYQRLKLSDARRDDQAARRVTFQGRGIQHHNMAITPEDIGLKARYKRNTKTSPYATKVTSPFSTKESPLTQKLRKATSPQEEIRALLDQLMIDIEDPHRIVNHVHNQSGLALVPYTVDQVRLLSQDEIQQLYNSLENQENKRNIFTEMIVMAGTDASIMVIKRLVEQRKLTGEHATHIISSLAAYILDPQPAILDEIWALCKNPMLKENRQLYVTCLLAFGEMVNQACVPKAKPKVVKPYHVKVTGCPVTLTTRYLQEIMRIFEQTNENWEKSTIMYSILRMGVNETLDFLVPYFQSKIFDFSPGLRAEMLMTLYESGPGRHEEVAKYVLPLFYNTTLTALERITAFEVLAYTTTSQELMNQIAMSTWNEPDHHVHTFIYSYFTAVGNNEAPCWAPMAIRSRQALSLAKPIDIGLIDSKHTSLFSYYTAKYSIGSHLTSGQVFSPNTLIPIASNLYFYQEFLGHFYSTFEVLTINEGLQRFLDYTIGPQADFVENVKFSDLFKNDDSQEGDRRNRNNNDNMKFVPRQSEPMATRIMYSYLQNRHRLYFLDENTLNDIRNSGIIPPRKDVYSSLRDGITLNFKNLIMVQDYQRKFPSIIGIPLKLEMRVPGYMEIKGKISLEATKTGITNALSNVILKPELQITYAANSWIGVSIEVPYSKKLSGAKATSSAHITLPINGYLNADLTQKSFTMSLHKQQGATGPASQSTFQYRVKIIPILGLHDLQTKQSEVHIIQNKDTTEHVDLPLPGLSLPLTIKHETDVPIQVRMASKHTKHANPLESLMSHQRYTYKTLEISHESTAASGDQLEVKIDWKHTPSPYETELWKSKSLLERVRLWNLVPEWKEFPVVCNQIQTNARLQAAATEPPKKKGWFSRIKDKVKSTFGRSGGDDGDSDVADSDVADDEPDRSKEEDKKDNEEDRGRALYPHLTTGESGISGDYGGARSSLVSSGGSSQSQYGSSSQSRSTQGGYGHRGQYGGNTGGQDYGQSQTQDGQDYSQSQHGGYGQSQHGGYGQSQHGDYGQSQHGGYGQSQNGDITDEDWSQRPGGGQQPDDFSQQSQHGGGQGPFDPSDRIRGQRKAVVSKLNFRDETSTTLIAAQINYLGTLKRQLHADITITKNIPEGSTKVSAIMDLANLFQHPYPQNNYKVCLNADYYRGFGLCQNKGQTNPVFDAKLQWGDNCDSKNYVSLKMTSATKPYPENLRLEFQRRCGQEIQNGLLVTPECIKRAVEFSSLKKVNYELRHSTQIPNQIIDDAIEDYLKCNLGFHNIAYGSQNNLPDGTIKAELDYHLFSSLMDIIVTMPKKTLVTSHIQYPNNKLMLSYPASSTQSYTQKLANILTNGKISSNCAIHDARNAIYTFSGLEYNYTLGECPHILAKDCSPSNLFTVTSSGGPNKKVSVEILGHTIDASAPPRPNQRVEFFVDEKPEAVQEGQIAVVRSQGNEDQFLAHVSGSDSNIIIQSPPLGLIVAFNRDAIKITVSSFWKGKVCGICGEDTDDVQNTFLDPSQCRYGNPADFARSYRLQSVQKCSAYGNIQSQSQCVPMKPTKSGHLTGGYGTGGVGGHGSWGQSTGGFGSGGYGSGVSQTSGVHQTGGFNSGSYGAGFGSEQSTGERDFLAQSYDPLGTNANEGNCYVRRNKFKLVNEPIRGLTKVKKACFSTTPVVQCQEPCVAANYLPQVLQFQCFRESSPEANNYMAVVEERPLTELVSTRTDFEEEVMVPQKCSPKY